MPEPARKILRVVSWAALVAAFSMGTAWATQQSALDGKLDASRFVADSANRVLRDSLLFGELRAIRATGDKTAVRVRDIYCADKPAGCQ